MITLGQKIKALRKEKRMTQEELSGSRITRNQLSLIENGINNPSIPTLEFLADRLGKPMSFFLSDDEFLLVKSQSLINQCELLLEDHDYKTIIDKIEDFLGKLENLDSLSYRPGLGLLYFYQGLAYFYQSSDRAEEL